MSASRTARTTIAASLAAVLTGALALAGAGSAHAAPGSPGVPGAARVVFHEDFEQAPDTGRRTMLGQYVGATGEHYTADPYWIDNVKANGMVLSWGNTAYPADGSGAQNGTEETAFNTLRQLSEAIGTINGSAAPRTNTVISAYTQSKGAAPAGGKVMFRTVEDIELADSQGRFLAFSMSAAATNAQNPAATGMAKDRQNPQLMLYVDRDGVEQPLTSAPIDPLTDPRSRPVAVSELTPGASETVRAGTFASDRSFLYEGGEFGVVVRNTTSAHLGNDGAFDDIEILDVTPQLDKQFSTTTATTGESVRLTFTVTNTAELAGKAGWSFTDQLPAGLVVADQPNLVVDGTATVVADPGAAAITVTAGELEEGDAALTLSVDVTARTAGTYTNGPDNIVVRRGLDSPGTSTVTVEDPAPVPAELVVRYVDEDGVEIAAGERSEGTVDSPYATAAKEIPGYTLIAAPANATGVYTDGTTEVVYVYRKIEPAPPVDPDPVDPVDPADPGDPARPTGPATVYRSEVLAAGETGTAGPRVLATTGSPAGALGGLALVLALSGAALVLVRRRGDRKEA